jgi:hypothetical protein
MRQLHGDQPTSPMGQLRRDISEYQKNRIWGAAASKRCLAKVQLQGCLRCLGKGGLRPGVNFFKFSVASDHGRRSVGRQTRPMKRSENTQFVRQLLAWGFLRPSLVGLLKAIEPSAYELKPHPPSACCLSSSTSSMPTTKLWVAPAVARWSHTETGLGRGLNPTNVRLSRRSQFHWSTAVCR